MTGEASWQLNGNRATLRCGDLAASLDALLPRQGLHDLTWRGEPLADSRLLAVLLDATDAETPADLYRRGGDLIARYGQTSQRPFAVQVYWRANLVAMGNDRFPCCDLVVSVETQHLDIRPSIDAASAFATLAGAIVGGADYSIARLAASDRSYVEIYHPDDVLTRTIDAGESGVRLSTRLFGQPLEKGVILRSRLRGLFVPRADDEAIARRALDDFVALPPPLTT